MKAGRVHGGEPSLGHHLPALDEEMTHAGWRAEDEGRDGIRLGPRDVVVLEEAGNLPAETPEAG